MTRREKKVKGYALVYKRNLYSKDDLSPEEWYKDQFGEEGQFLIFRKKKHAEFWHGNLAWRAVPVTITMPAAVSNKQLTKKHGGKGKV